MAALRVRSCCHIFISQHILFSYLKTIRFHSTGFNSSQRYRNSLAPTQLLAACVGNLTLVSRTMATFSRLRGLLAPTARTSCGWMGRVRRLYEFFSFLHHTTVYLRSKQSSNGPVTEIAKHYGSEITPSGLKFQYSTRVNKDVKLLRDTREAGKDCKDVILSCDQGKGQRTHLHSFQHSTALIFVADPLLTPSSSCSYDG